MNKNNLFRITEQDVHIIVENSIKRILKEFYDDKNLKNLWNDAIDIVGVDEFVDLLDNGYDMGDIYDKLISVTGMSEEDLDAILPSEFIQLMQDILSPEEKYDILSFISEETGEFTVDDITDMKPEVRYDVETFGDDLDVNDEVSSENEVEVEDDEERKDPEFEGMNDYED